MKRILIALFLLLALALAAGALVVVPAIHHPYKGHTQPVIVQIAPGTRAPILVHNLMTSGVLARRWPFLVCYFAGRLAHRRVKAGEYMFDRALSPIDVYSKLMRGEIYLHTVLVPEGSDRFDIAQIVHDTMEVNPDDFLRLAGQAAAIHDLDPQATTLEGYLFPDTYRYPRGVAAPTIIQTMLTRFRRVFAAKFKTELEQSGKSLHDVITLASLVEKETPDPAERPVVAGVFARRLEKGMELACDPTVVYAARLDHRMSDHPTPPIKRSDLAFDSPYNTYLHAGQPPGPIANPGEASIRAALQPAPGDALYFVSNNHGGHVFAATLAEHDKNVAQYRKQLAQLRADGPGDGDSQDRAPAGPAKNAARPGGDRARHRKRGVTQRGKYQKQKAAHPRTGEKAGSGTSGR